MIPVKIQKAVPGGRLLMRGHTLQRIVLDDFSTGMANDSPVNLPENPLCPSLLQLAEPGSQKFLFRNCGIRGLASRHKLPQCRPRIRMAITPRSKEGQVHYYQTDLPPGN